MRRVVGAGAIALAALLGVARYCVLSSPASLVIAASGDSSGYQVSASSSYRLVEPGKVEPIFMPYLVTHTGSGLAVSCVAYRTISDPSRASYATLLATAQAGWARLGRYPRCTVVAAQPRGIGSAWYAFVRTRLPLPAARITPGMGVVNLPLLLGATGVTRAHAMVPTPDGPLSITALGTIWLEGPDGARLPASLVPTSVGTVEATAVEQWAGTYRLGAATGALPALVVRGRSASVEVVALSTELNAVS